MATIQKGDATYTIIDQIQTAYPDLVTLVVDTESMDTNEKQYWLDILPSMTQEQVDRLQNILETEKKQLEALEIKYQEEIKNLNEKHLIQWQDIQNKQAKAKIAAAEAGDTSKEKADNVLAMLDNI